MCPSEGFFLGGDYGMNTKEPELFCRQVNKLIEHGCEITDYEQAIMILNKINYYKLSAYFLPFRDNDGNYKQGTTLLQVYKIYEFDRKLSAFLYGIIQKIEVFVKTQIAYYHSNKYGALGYLDHSNVADKMIEKHKKLIDNFNTEVKRNKELPFVKHHIDNYDGKFPLWVAVELFTLGNTSQFYSQMKTADKKVITRSISYITQTECTYSQLESCLRCLTTLRNKCAHFGRIYYSRFKWFPSLPYEEEYKAYARGRNFIYLYPYLYIMKVLYPSPESWNGVVTELAALTEEYSNYIDINCIGFPDNWEEQLSRE